MSNLRVVVTGMGITSCVGLTLESLWDACRTNRSGIKGRTSEQDIFPPLTFFAPAEAFTSHINDFGEMPDALKKSIRKALKLMSREIQMGVAAAQRALHHSGIDSLNITGDRVGVSFASDYIITTPDEVLEGIKACSSAGKFDFSRWPSEGLAKMTPIWQLKFLPNMPASHLCIFNEFRGPCNAITNREASVAATVGEAVEIIRSGKADVMLIGATGSRLLPFKRIHTMMHDELASGEMRPEAACRPFDHHRTGTVPGEGAGALVLESEEFAKSRGATIYAEIVGASYRQVALSSGRKEANLPMGNCEQSLVHSMRALLDRYHVDPATIGHINACGYGMRNADAAEARAIRTIFNNLADSLPVTSLKGHIGNPGAGGGAIELIASILAMNENTLFPILNNQQDAPDCPIHSVRTFGGSPGDSFLKLVHEKFGKSGAILVKRYGGNH